MCQESAVKSLEAFRDGLPEEYHEGLPVLAAPAVLTDGLAKELLMGALGWPEDKATRLIEALHRCDFVIERN